MHRHRPALFKGRHFDSEIIVLCVRWYLRFGLSFRNLKEIMAERNLSVDHVTIWRWVQRYAPELNRRCRGGTAHDRSVVACGRNKFALPQLAPGRYRLVFHPRVAGVVDFRSTYYWPSSPDDAITLAFGQHLDAILWELTLGPPR